MPRPVPLARRLLVVLVALLGSALLVACGEEEQDAGTVLAETFGEDKDIRSGRLAVALRVDAPGLAELQGPVALRLSGPFATTGPGELPRFDFTVSLDGAGQTLEAGAVSTGDRGFLRFGGDAYAVGEELFRQFREGYAEQARCGEGREGASLGALGVDPKAWLRDPRVVGSEEVGGVGTTHVRAGVDVPRLLEDVSRVLSRARTGQGDPCGAPDGSAPEANALGDAERRRLAEAVRDARIEVWSGDDDRILRRLTVALRFADPDAGGTERAGTLTLDVVLGAVNEEQDIEAPADARPLEQLLQRFGGALPGGLGTGGTGGAGGAGGVSDELLRCLRDAGQDVGAQQRCAEAARP